MISIMGIRHLELYLLDIFIDWPPVYSKFKAAWN